MAGKSAERVAIFGGGGFIGSHLTRHLLDDFHLEIVDVSSEKINDVLDHERVEFHEIDISDPANDQKCQEIVNRSDIVLDLIAYANPKQYVDMPLEVVDLNYDQNLKLVEACVEADVWLVQFSTCEVYGKVGARTDDNVVFDEDSSNLVMGPVSKHRWIYATAKQLLERMVHAHGLQNGLDWTIVRPFNFIGPEMDYIVESPDEGKPRVFASFMSALLNDYPLKLVGDGTNRRTFTYIEDGVAGIETILNNQSQFHKEVVNIGAKGNEATIEEFAQLMRQCYNELSGDGAAPPVEKVSHEQFYGEGYDDIERRVPADEKLMNVGWSAEYSLEEAIRASVQYYIDKHEGEKPTTT